MRVLVIAARGFERGDALGTRMAEALERAGHEVSITSHRDVLRANPLPRLAPLRRLYARRAGRAVLAAARRSRPELVLVVKGETLTSDLLSEIKAGAGARLVNLFPDNPYYYPSVLPTVPIYDRFLVKDSFVLQQMHLMGAGRAAYLLPCADPEGTGAGSEPDERERARFGCQVVLIGSLYPHRYELLAALAHLDVKVWGSSIAPELGPEAPHVRRWWQGRPLVGREKGAGLRSASVAFNSHHPLNDIYGVNKRSFEICGAGAFQVVDAKVDLERCFDVGRELVAYRSIGELREVVAHYLERPEERRDIAARGLARVRKEHTYDHRALEIMAMAGLG
ncbi:MAG: glycosyltransferase [Planctomycetes bacterium]|nr:glycosyltransferase [Planctomycetota bacterium]